MIISIFDPHNCWLWFIIGLPVLLFIWYIIGSISSGGSILTSKKSNGSGEEEADLLYHLPTAAIQVKATAKIFIRRTVPDNKVTDTWLGELALENTVLIQPDTSQLLLANFTPSIFANDEVHITATNQGLLENIAVTAEDRISNIVGIIAKAPQSASGLNEFRKADSKDKEKVSPITADETLEFTSTFIILPGQLQQATYTKKWMIHLDGIDADKATVDASIMFEIPVVETHKIAEKKIFNGLLTRPRRTVTLGVKTKPKDSTEFSKVALLTYDVLIPDISRLAVVPIKRAAFVKSQYTPKFNAGVLIENSITKPSEVEAFLSIPINILKAVFALPAQLFNFKITNIKQQTELEALQQKLKEQQAAGNKTAAGTNIPPAPNTEKPAQTSTPNQLVASSAAVNGMLKYLTQNLPNTPLAAPAVLGKLPIAEASADARNAPVLHLEALLAPAGGPFAPPPAERKWFTNVTQPWDSYRNESIPDCVPAAAAHMIMTWSATTGQIKVPTLDEVQAAYYLTGELGKGCDLTKFLKFWKFTGLGADMITDFAKMQEKNIEKVKFAVNYFGGCLAGFQMPKTAQNTNTWEKPTGALTGDAAPGTWCPHAVSIVGYSNDVLYGVSLGQLVTITADFYNTYNDESHVILSKTNWINTSQISPEGTAFNKLRTSISTLTA